MTLTSRIQSRKYLKAKQETIEAMAEFILKYIIPSTPHIQLMKTEEIGTSEDINDTRFR